MDFQVFTNVISRFMDRWISGSIKNTYWLIETMDLTQWGIVACVFVFLGFLALKTKM